MVNEIVRRAPLVRCPYCGSDCELVEIREPSEKDPTYEFQFDCDLPLDEYDEGRRCATWFKVVTDLDFNPVGLVEVGSFNSGAQQYEKVPFSRVRKTRQSGRFAPFREEVKA